MLRPVIRLRLGPLPLIDHRLTGRPHRYLTVAAVSGKHDLTRGEHDRLVRWDMVTGSRHGRPLPVTFPTAWSGPYRAPPRARVAQKVEIH